MIQSIAAFFFFSSVKNCSWKIDNIGRPYLKSKSTVSAALDEQLYSWTEDNTYLSGACEISQRFGALVYLFYGNDEFNI